MDAALKNQAETEAASLFSAFQKICLLLLADALHQELRLCLIGM